MLENMLKRSIRTYTQNMKNFYELSGGVEHDGEKGAFREFFLTQLIKPLIPYHFGVGSGVVEDFTGKQSHQTDVIIYDRRLLPPTLLAGDRGIFPIDSVLCAIEVKSVLKSSHYKDIIRSARYFYPKKEDNPNGLFIARPGNLKGGTETTYPLFSVFAYTSDADKDERERLEEQVPGGSYYARVIGVLDKGVWSYQNGKFLDQNEINNSLKFLNLTLDRLEETAKSRGDYSLKEWFCLQKP
jgi:hypothetical protein